MHRMKLNLLSLSLLLTLGALFAPPAHATDVISGLIKIVQGQQDVMDRIAFQLDDIETNISSEQSRLARIQQLIKNGNVRRAQRMLSDSSRAIGDLSRDVNDVRNRLEDVLATLEFVEFHAKVLNNRRLNFVLRQAFRQHADLGRRMGQDQVEVAALRAELNDLARQIIER